MGRPRRIQFEGAFYHIYNRGVDKAKIVWDERDRRTFLQLVSNTVINFRLRLFAYCLMTNHYHLFFQIQERNLDRAIQYLQGQYGRYIHERHERVGPLFQGRYQSRLVETDPYSLVLVRYIHQNPVEAGMVQRVDDYPWSSYPCYTGLFPKWKWLETEWILSQFDEDTAIAEGMFRKFHQECASEEMQQELKCQKHILGSAQFAEAIGVRHGV